MSYEFCPRCEAKKFEQSSCDKRWRCKNCWYFLNDNDFQSLKDKNKKEVRASK